MYTHTHTQIVGIYIYIYMCMCVCVCVYIYIYDIKYCCVYIPNKRGHTGTGSNLNQKRTDVYKQELTVV
jgi:hypothetical protein